jgi:hypothetical protein
MERTPYDGIEELIEEYVFREEAEIRIPKRIRRRAFTLQIDIEITSVSKTNYRNFKSSPANGFYGYVTLIQRDYADLIIPIEQPRQRIYYHINDMAHNSWYNLYLFLLWVEERRFFYNDRLNLIEIELGVEAPEATFQCPVKPIWQEATLREMFVKCDKGTEFKIEISYWQAKPMEIGECAYDGTSGIVDGDKDGGLPEDGSQPNQADDPNNPFADRPNPSSDESLGDLLLDKLNKNDNENPDNESEMPPPSELTKFCNITIIARGDGGNVISTVSFTNIEIPRESNFFVMQAPATKYGGSALEFNPDGIVTEIRVAPQNDPSSSDALYFDGGIVSATPAFWTRGSATLEGSCTFEPS